MVRLRVVRCLMGGSVDVDPVPSDLARVLSRSRRGMGCDPSWRCTMPVPVRQCAGGSIRCVSACGARCSPRRSSLRRGGARFTRGRLCCVALWCAVVQAGRVTPRRRRSIIGGPGPARWRSAALRGVSLSRLRGEARRAGAHIPAPVDGVRGCVRTASRCIGDRCLHRCACSSRCGRRGGGPYASR